MARMTYSQKTVRVLKFLEASVDPRINPPLAAAGYGNEDVEEGWELLRRAGLVRKVQEQPTPVSPRVREDLDRFENYWFPIVSASLKRRFPEIHAKVFQNLHREEGASVAINVSIFLERVRQIPQQQQGAEAIRLLQTRGLTEEVLQEAEQLVADFTAVQPAPPHDLEELRAEHERAVDAAWQWYLEWSTIARAVVTNRRHLRMLGFLTGSSRASQAEDEEEAQIDREVSESGFPERSDDFEVLAG